MSITLLTLPALLLILLCAGQDTQPLVAITNSQQGIPASPSPSPSRWPNLDVITIPGGTRCGLAGQPHGDPERAAQNRLRNRYHLPKDGFENRTLQELEQPPLPQGKVVEQLKAVKKGKLVKQTTLVNYPKSDDKNHLRAVSVVGRVLRVLVLGCGAGDEVFSSVLLPPKKGVESANCYTNDQNSCTIQIFITPDPDPNVSHDDGRNVFVVNVTRRSRWLASHKYLNSNIGLDWSAAVLREKIQGKWVRFSGWLFFNQNYRERAWVSDPEDVVGKPNDRQSAWGIHPVMGLEVVDSPNR
jgi:hypothetical protein